MASEPFAQVAIDIIGPLPVCKKSSNRFILMVLDLCTHYPEAVIPLKQHTTADVTQALGTLSLVDFALQSLLFMNLCSKCGIIIRNRLNRDCDGSLLAFS